MGPDHHQARTEAAIGAAILTTLGALHANWARGSTWPAPDARTLAETVLGGPFARQSAGGEVISPGAAPTLGVAVLLWLAALTVLGRAGLWGRRLPQRPFHMGTWGVAGAFTARAAIGCLGSGIVYPRNATRFAMWDARLYSPLCLALGLLCSRVAWRPRPE